MEVAESVVYILILRDCSTWVVTEETRMRICCGAFVFLVVAEETQWIRMGDRSFWIFGDRISETAIGFGCGRLFRITSMCISSLLSVRRNVCAPLSSSYSNCISEISYDIAGQTLLNFDNYFDFLTTWNVLHTRNYCLRQFRKESLLSVEKTGKTPLCCKILCGIALDWILPFTKARFAAFLMGVEVSSGLNVE